MSIEDFESGKLSYLLDKADTFSRKNIWSHDTVNGYPIFADNGNRPVYKINIENNSGGTLSAPTFAMPK